MIAERHNATIENRILHGLSCEWETALWVLPPNLSASMKRPVFSLHNGNSRLAFWKPSTREISFSKSFVLSCSWDSVKEVLLHEMAHQMTSEVFQIQNESPHGPGFNNACRLLKANPKASGSFKPLSDRLHSNAASENDRLMMKIKKLLALATSVNQFEAEAAITKAHELIKKHNIDLIEHNRQRDFITVFAGKPSLRHYKEEYLLASLLTTHYCVYGIWVSAYVIEKGKMGSVLEISGERSSVQFASYVYDYINSYITMSWNQYKKGTTLNRYRKSDFAAGLIKGFHDKLTADLTSQASPQSNPGEIVPMTVDDPGLLRYITDKYPSVKKVKKKMSAKDESIIEAGEEAGKKMIISKGIEHTSTSRIHRLT